MSANLRAIRELVKQLAESAREKCIERRTPPSSDDARLYEDLVLYTLYSQINEMMELAIQDARVGKPMRGIAVMFESVRNGLRHYLQAGKLLGVEPPDAAHLFACFFQIRRAFDEIFNSIIGSSISAAKLRAAIWQSIFTHDMRRYRRSLFDRTADFTTLIVGPSGTGKELVAGAIAAARYIPFDAKTKSFTQDFATSFYPLNLSALSPTLVESELFGHRRGAFTGAVDDRAGWLQTCPALGTVFLDEIGELDPAIQVKLLRVLQTRQFQRLGDTKTIHFHGKIIAATNRDLATDMTSGAFRRDFYYRLCGDIITTPTLYEQLRDSKHELPRLVRFVAARLVPTEDVEPLVDETIVNIDRRLGPDYAWPGNFRELEQCVRNVLVRGDYHPTATAVPEKPSRDALTCDIADGILTADQLLTRYCVHVYGITGTYEATALRLGIDRRTVAARVKASQSHVITSR